MIDKFKSFIGKLKNKKTPEVFDYDYNIDLINSVIQSLNDISGVNVYKSNVVVQKNPELFRLKYHVHLIDPNYDEVINELLNCKSHLKSENLIIELIGRIEKKVQTDRLSTDVSLDLNFDNISRLSDNTIKFKDDRFTILVYTQEFFHNKRTKDTGAR